MDRGVWWATVHGVAELGIDWSDLGCMHALLNHMGGNHFNLGGIPSGLMEEKCLKGNKEKKKGDNVSKLEFIKMQVNFQARSNDLILHFMGNVKLCNFRVG